MSNYKEILAPTLGTNDEYIKLIQWHIADNEKVEAGQNIAELEGTKTAIDLQIDAPGYFYKLVDEGDEVISGSPIGLLTGMPNLNIVEEYKKLRLQNHEKKCDEVTLPEDLKLTNRARELLKNSKVDFTLLPRGKILKEDDIKLFIETSKSTAPKVEITNNHISNCSPDYFIKNQNHNKVLIYGGGGHGKMCIDVLRQMGLYEIHGIIDDNLDTGSLIMNIPVIGTKACFGELYREGYHMVINGIGATKNHQSREKIFNYLKNIGYFIPNIIHPRASIEPSVKLGEGNQIMANATIGSNAIIGDNCIINAGAIISHDCKLSNNVHISPGAILAGGVEIDSNSLIGMGSTTYLYVKIGKNVTVFNGCRVNKNVSDNAILKC